MKPTYKYDGWKIFDNNCKLLLAEGLASIGFGGEGSSENCFMLVDSISTEQEYNHLTKKYVNVIMPILQSFKLYSPCEECYLDCPDCYVDTFYPTAFIIQEDGVTRFHQLPAELQAKFISETICK